MWDSLVINTGPLIALASACGDWQVLVSCIRRPVVPTVVLQEVRAGPRGSPGQEIRLPDELEIASEVAIPHHLLVSLDAGEAAVIATALALGIPGVAIDELAGRRVARIHGLQVTGSLGILVEHARRDATFSLDSAMQRMVDSGIHLSAAIMDHARQAARR